MRLRIGGSLWLEGETEELVDFAVEFDKRFDHDDVPIEGTIVGPRSLPVVETTMPAEPAAESTSARILSGKPAKPATPGAATSKRSSELERSVSGYITAIGYPFRHSVTEISNEFPEVGTVSLVDRIYQARFRLKKGHPGQVWRHEEKRPGVTEYWLAPATSAEET